MDHHAPTPVTDVTAAEWIAPRLRSGVGEVGFVAPGDYPAYARVLHPVPDRGGLEPVARWADVCTHTGRVAHALMQWNAIAGVVEQRIEQPWRRRTVTTRSILWPGGEPEIGNLEPGSLRVLCDVLARHTATDAECFFAVWEGWGWVHGSPSASHLSSDGSWESVPPAFPPEVIDGPRLRLPYRDHLLFSGSLRTALAVGDPRGFWPQSPSLFWPTDRSWCVATEIDFDSTIVAGSSALVRDVLAEPALETWRIGPEASLAADGDTINSSRRGR